MVDEWWKTLVQRRRVLALWLALALLVLASCASTMKTRTGTSIAPPAPQWEQIALPPAAPYVVTIAPSPIDPASVFVCASHSGSNMRTFQIWHTSDSGAQWGALPMPPTIGRWCIVTIARDAPQRILAMIAPATQSLQPCADITFWLSSDGGATWKRHTVSFLAPTGASVASCIVAPTAHHLYSLFSYVFPAQTSDGDHKVVRFARSDDDGQIWQYADHDLGVGNEYSPVKLGNDETFATGIIHWPPRDEDVELWATQDGGRHWTQVYVTAGDLTLLPTPGSSGIMPTARHPWYSLLDEQFDQVAIFETRDAQGWTPIALFGTKSTISPSIVKVLGVLPNGDLLALGLPSNTSNMTPTPTAIGTIPYDVWIWHTQRAQWQEANVPLSLNLVKCGLCPSSYVTFAASGQGAIAIWVASRDGTLYRLLLTSL